MIRTERPDAGALITVADALAIPALRGGRPDVLVGGALLDVPVRWAHISDSEDAARMLEGGELLLTTGAGWPGADDRLRALAEGLHSARAAGIVLELGGRFPTVPPALVQTCRDLGLALVVLEQEVKFVAVTEAIHRLITQVQFDALQARQRVHDLFTGLSLRGAPAGTVVRETARILGAPVLLRTAADETVAFAAAGREEAQVLDAFRDGEVWERVTVEARGTRWGRLHAHPDAGHPAGVLTVLESAATALALGRLADGDDRAWERAASTALVRDLLDESFATPADARARLESGGFPVHGRVLHTLVVRDADAAMLDAVTASLSTRGAVRQAVDGRDGIVLVSLPDGIRASEVDPLLAGVGAALAASGAGAAWGPRADGVEGIAASVRAARVLAARAVAGTVARGDGRPLIRLAGELQGDPRLAALREELLAPLEEWDAAHRGDLVEVLRALVAHPTSRTAAAAASGLSRSVFYQRLELIADLTDADLEDGETLAALQLALLA
ncbi:PucR family transcriptional regulator [Microbacterium bovistercoris]|uniref:PucR family transcriptional regulator n=1 Tax=Microbacterium bovistercoris TaxID=2293570 RepID=UPI0015F2537B|nr:PucR family transcriptional regulator ligand-binding domain-containing protein [Microbacterium bovistercoris]